MVLDSRHLADAVHAEHRFADIHCRDSEASRNGRTNRRAAGHVVTHDKCLIRNVILFTKQLELGIGIHIASVTLLCIDLEDNSTAQNRGMVRLVLGYKVRVAGMSHVDGKGE